MDTNDIKALYETEVAPLLKQVQDACEKHGINFTAAIAFLKTPDTGDFHTISYIDDDKLLPPKMQIAHQILISDDTEDTPAAKLLQNVIEKGSPVSIKLMNIEPAQLADILAKKFESQAAQECNCPVCVAKREGRVATSSGTKH